MAHARTTTAIRFSQEVHDRLVEESRRLNISINDIVNRAAEKYVDELRSVERLLP